MLLSSRADGRTAPRDASRPVPLQQRSIGRRQRGAFILQTIAVRYRHDTTPGKGLGRRLAGETTSARARYRRMRVAAACDHTYACVAPSAP